MKKLIYLFILGIGFTSCSVESLDSTENLLTADAKFKAQNVEKFNAPAEICAGVLAQFSFEAALKTNLQVQQYVNEDWVQVYQISQSTSNPQTFELSFAEPGTYALRYKIGGGGFTETTVTVINCNPCDESFSYIENENGSYTFTYIPAEDMAEANVVFTFAQSVVASGYIWPNWNGNSSTRTEIMDLDACRVYTWNVFLTGDCSGNSSNSNLWTDFKVNEASKKGELSNILRACSK